MLVTSSISAAFSLSRFIVYSELDNILIYGRLGIHKFISPHIHIVVSGYLLRLYGRFFNARKQRDNLKCCITHIQDCLRSTCFGVTSKYRMKGLGHRIFFFHNNFLFKLGYSHFIYKMLPLNLKHHKKRNKKKPFFAIRGTNIASVRNSMFTIQSYRLPNCYDKNGIWVRDVIVELKKSKKRFLL